MNLVFLIANVNNLLLVLIMGALSCHIDANP